jgi:ectoine hydroxylase-related dioxygenase (phytanoyl-CoA dioxygenase family)
VSVALLLGSAVTEEMHAGAMLPWLKSVDEHGFAIIPGVLTRDEVARLLEDLSRLTLRRTKAGIRHVLGHAPVAKVAREPRLLEIARGVLGSEAFPFRATLFDKSPCANWLVVWHQDTALPLRDRREAPGWGPWSVKEGIVYAHAPASALCRVLALRVHLDESTARNGPLRVVPGSHDKGLLTDNEVHELAARSHSVDCPVSIGGVLAMRPMLVHSSSKSQVQEARRVLHIEYAASATVGEGLELAIA